MAIQGGGGRFSALLLEGLDHYRKGRMLDAVKAWEEAYLLEPTNLRAREFLRSALERIHAVMSPAKAAAEGERQGRAPALRDVRAEPDPHVREQDRGDGRAPAHRHSPGRDHLAEPRSAGRLRPRADRRRSLLRRPVRDLRPQAARHRPHPLRAARAGRGPGPGPRPGSRQARSAAELRRTQASIRKSHLPPFGAPLDFSLIWA